MVLSGRRLRTLRSRSNKILQSWNTRQLNVERDFKDYKSLVSVCSARDLKEGTHQSDDVPAVCSVLL